MLEVVDRGVLFSFSFEDMLRYHGPHSPGGVAHAYKVLERALPLLSPDRPPRRRTLTIRTAFGGPGARDGFELVTRAVSEGRYHLEPALERPERGRAAERFVFVLTYGSRSVTLVLRDGIVSEEFIDLARTDARTPEQEARLDAMKRDMSKRVMARPADEVYDVDP